MIVVIGAVAYRSDPAGRASAAGLAAGIAAEAAAAGARAELLARIGEDGAGEEVLLALARRQVGHLAVVRDPSRPTALAPTGAGDAFDGAAEGADDAPPGALLAAADAGRGTAAGSDDDRGAAPRPAPPLEPADLALGLEYLREFRVLVAVEPIADGGAAVIARAASFLDAALVVIATPGRPVADDYAAATVIEAPPADPDGAFARLVGRFAAGLDAGVMAGEAFRAAAEGVGWEPAAT